MAARYITTPSGGRILDPRSTAAWRRLRKQVRREEPVCWLQLSGCTGVSTTADHVIPVTVRPDLALLRSNCRGACAPCNFKRGNLAVEELRRGERETPPALRIFDR